MYQGQIIVIVSNKIPGLHLPPLDNQIHIMDVNNSRNHKFKAIIKDKLRKGCSGKGKKNEVVKKI